MDIVAHDRYTGNQGDSTIFNLNKKGLSQNDDGKTFSRYGNVGLNGEVFENGFEAWIARWNFGDDISWASATFDISDGYSILSGKTSLIKSYNTTQFDTTVYFYSNDILLASYRLTPTDYEQEISIDVSNVKHLKILVKDNTRESGGTSFALYDMFLEKDSPQDEFSPGLNIELVRKGGSYVIDNTLTVFAYDIIENTDGSFSFGYPHGISSVVSDSSVIKLLDYENHDTYALFTFQITETGTAIISFSDEISSTPVNMILSVATDKYASFRADSLPCIQYDVLGCKDQYNAYVNGMYISDVVCEPMDKEIYNIKFNVYNTLYIPGTVEIYDKNGVLQDIEIISKFEDISSLKSAYTGAKNMICDFFSGDTFSFRGTTDSKHTPIDIKVPADGYIVITNSCNSSPYCSYVNIMDFFLTGCSFIKSTVKFEPATKDYITKETLLAVLEYEYGPTALKEMQEKLWNSIDTETQELSVYFLYGLSVDIYQELIERIDAANIDELFKKASISYASSTLQTVLSKGGGPAGIALEGIFYVQKALNFQCQSSDLCNTYNRRDGFVMFPPYDIESATTIKTSNGFIATQENPDPHAILQVYKIAGYNNDGRVNNDKNNYLCYDISLQKDGKEIQPNSPIKIYIPLPESWVGAYGVISVQKKAEDGSWEYVPATVGREYIVIYIDHFCDFMINFQKNLSIATCDVNGDGAFDYFDVAKLYACFCGKTTIANESIKDINGDGTFDYFDVSKLYAVYRGDAVMP